MKDDLLSRALNVTSAESGAVFADTRLRRILMMFTAGPLSVAEAAARSGDDLKRLHHRVQKLCRSGLLVVAAERRRAGRPIKLYRAVSDVFFVPVEMLPRGFGDELAEELRGYLSASARRTTRGLLVAAAGEGRVKVRIVPDEEADPDILEVWSVLRLERDEAKALQAELARVINRFKESASGRGKTYLVHSAMARRTSGNGREGGPG
jgi:hypothetical protein